MSSDKAERDDLTIIPGIGPVRQQWLAETFGVRTYAGLAVLSADEIEAKLTADGKPFTRDAAEHWIQEAAELAAKKEEPGIKSAVVPSATAPAKSPKEKAEPGPTVTPNVEEEQWQQIALFQVEFQKRRLKGAAAKQRTVINYHETDKWHEWPHIETEKIGRWIVEQAGDKLRPSAEEVLEVKPEPKAAVRLSVAITRVSLHQPAGTEVPISPGKSGRPYFGVLRASLPFAVETDIELGELDANGKLEIPYQAQFYANNRITGEKIHLGDAEPGLLVSGEITSASLTRIALPPGRYRLQALVAPEREDVAPAYFEVPMLEVV